MRMLSAFISQFIEWRASETGGCHVALFRRNVLSFTVQSSVGAEQQRIDFKHQHRKPNIVRPILLKE